MYTKEQVKQEILSSESAVERAILRLYKLQTDDEQQSGTTNHNNNLGFNGSDANFGTSLAEKIMSDRPLSVKQLVAARSMLMKYVTQLTKQYNKLL